MPKTIESFFNLARNERELIILCLRYFKGNRTYAHKVLGVARRTLGNKIALYQRLGYKVPEPQKREKKKNGITKRQKRRG